MDKQSLESYLTQSLNMTLASQIQGETSYTNSFNIKVEDEGFLFIPRLPAGYIVDSELFNRFF